VPLDQLKLSKPLELALAEAGINLPREIQLKTVSRIIGGQTILAVGPEGCGKTTALVLGTLMRLKFAQEEAPRALFLVPDKERGLELLSRFELIGKYTNLRCIGLFAGAGVEGQRETLAAGTDIVVGTPDRVEFIYSKSGLNLNKLKIFVLDDAALLVQHGFHIAVLHLTESLPKCQHLIFTDVFHSKLERLTDAFMNHAERIEVGDYSDLEVETIDCVLYKLPNYKTKLNLLNQLLRDSETTNKAVIFTNTSLTAENIYKSLARRITGEVALLKLLSGTDEDIINSVDSVYDFLASNELRVLVIPNDFPMISGYDKVPFTLHFDVPVEREILIERIKRNADETQAKRSAIIFATDPELSNLKKAEQSIGKPFPVEALPFGLIIEGDRSAQKDATGQGVPIDNAVPEQGAAFHEKKESNAKEYNYKYKDRLKMFGKKNIKGKRM
jgi:ATP-dependent RNA helicase RhlE